MKETLKWILSLCALIGLVAMGRVGAQGLPSFQMWGTYNGLPRPLAVDASGNLNISASISGADGAIQDGVTSSIRASVLNLAGSKPLSVAILDGSGTQITSFGGGTQYANGAAQATPTGTVSLGWDGTNVRALSTSNTGVLAVSLSSVPAHNVTNAGTFAVQAAESGTWTVQPGNTANTTAWLVTGTGGTFPVTDSGGSLTVDAPVGTPVFVRLSDGAAAISTLPVSLASLPNVTNGGTFVVQENGSALTALQLIDNPVGSASGGSAGTSSFLAGGIYNSSPITLTTGQQAGLQLDANGYLAVNIKAGAGSGGTAATDNSAFTAGTTNITPSGGFYESSVTACTAGRICAPGLTAQRTAKVTLYNSSGTELTPSSDATHNSAAITTGPQLMAYGSSTVPTAVTTTNATRLWAGLNGQLAVMLVDSAGSGVSVGGGTQYTQSNALTIATTVGTMAMGRASAAAPSTTGVADDDAVLPWYLATGAMVSQPTYAGVLATTGNGVSGTGVQRVTLASDSTGQVTLAAGAATIGSLAANQSVNVAQINGVTTTMGNGVSGTGVQRVTLASDSTGQVTLAAGANTIGALTANQSVNVAQINGVATTMGNGVSGTGVQRVTLASDSTGVLATVSTVTSLSQFAGNAINLGNGTTGTGTLRVTLSSDSTGTVVATQGTAANLNVRTDTSGATGSAPPARADYIAGLVGGATGGLTQGVPVCESQAFLNMTTATTTEIVPLTASRTVHICHISLLANGTTTATLKRGTGTNCGTGTTAIGPDWNLTAQVGFVAGSGFGEVIDGRSSGNAVCVTNSAAVNLQAFVRYGVW